MEFLLSDTTIIAIMGIVVAIVTAWIGLQQYRLQGQQKRATFFLGTRRKFEQNLEFKTISNLLEHDDPKLKDLSFEEKRDFLTFFEEIALMMHSSLIRKEVAHYMFGYYAIRCWKSDNFWSNLNRESTYWCNFKNLVMTLWRIDTSPDFQLGSKKYIKNLKF